MDEEDKEQLLRDISKSLAKSQRHLKSIADCLRVIVGALLVVLFLAYQYHSKGYNTNHAAEAAKAAVAATDAAHDAATAAAASAVAVPTPANPPVPVPAR